MGPLGLRASDWAFFWLAIILIGLLAANKFGAPLARRVSEHAGASMGLLFSLAVLLRIVLLPRHPMPIPSGADDFGYLLLGDTLAHFRLANAMHPLHQFFEAVFILQQPTYASIYPLGQGLVLAFGKLVFGSYWVGVLISSGALSALCYWMLRGWVTPIWALAGGLLAVMEFGPLNPWVNSYWGGAVSACAGCLVFGALPRLRESGSVRSGVLLGVGFGLQILTRPFEAVFLGAAVLLYCDWRAFAKPALAALGVIAAALGLTLLHNKAVTQSWLTMPYMLSRYQYGVPATLTVQANAVPHRQMTAEQAADYQAQSTIHGPGRDSLKLYVERLAYRFRYLRFFLLPPLYFALAAFLRRVREWRYLWALGTTVLFALGTNFYPYFYPQYVAAVTCLLVLFSVEGLAQMAESQRRFVWLLCGGAFIFWFGAYLLPPSSLTSYQSWNYINWGDPQGRAEVERQLTQNQGQQLVFVRYSASHQFEEWIHNEAEIDAARIVWANDLGSEENETLLRYYPKRKAWLLEPDAQPPALHPYASETSPFVTVQ